MIKTQTELQNEFMEQLEKAPIYRKFVTVQARPAIEGEQVVTITSTGEENINTAVKGDFIVKNPTGEQYIASGFEKRYEHVEGNTYQAIGKVRAIVYKGDFFEFVTPWDETQKMPCYDNNILACDLDFKGGIRRIDTLEFLETYTRDL